MRQLMFRISAIAVIGLATLIALEVGLRFFPYYSGLVASHVDDAQPVFRFLPNRDVLYSQGPDMKNSRVRHINNDGFLSNIDYDPEDQRPLLAIIGDSYIEAIHVDWEDSVHGRLHRKLAPDVQVYAFGASFAALAQYLAWAEYVRKTYKPGMVIVNVVGNDLLQKLSKTGQPYKAGFRGMHYFAEDDAGELVIRRSDRPRDSFLVSLARHSALIAYAYRNAVITHVPARISELIQDWLNPPEVPKYAANTSAIISDDELVLSKRQIDLFLELLPQKSGLQPQEIVITMDGLRPDLYDDTELERSRTTFPARMFAYMAEKGQMLGYEVIWLESLFAARHRATGERFEYSFNNHWNASGHAVMADAVLSSRTFARVFGQ